MNIVKSSLVAWPLFGVGISLVLAGFVVWTALTGVSWWTSPNKALADRILWRFVAGAFLVCVTAPLLSAAPLWRRLLFSVLAAVAVAIAYYACGFIHLSLYGV